MRRALLAGASAAALACAQAGPDRTGFAAAAEVAREVVEANPIADVHALAAGHDTDVRLSCEGYETRDRYPACELSRDAAVAHVSSRLAGMGYAPETVSFADPSGAGVALNVIAERPGTTRPGEVVLVMAHHDAFYQGADDNSSGVAVLLEVARVAAGHEFDRTIRFVSVDLEERGAVGSTRYVEAGLADDAVAAIVLESVGFTCATRGCQDAPAGMEFGEVGDYLMIAGNEGSSSTAQRLVALANGEDLVRALGVLVPGDGAWLFTSAFLRSDNGPLWLRGVPAVMFTHTANFRNPNYHLASDTPDTLDPAFLAGVARATAAAVALLAGVRP